MRVGFAVPVLVTALFACKEEWANHDLHVLNPIAETDETLPEGNGAGEDGGAAVAAAVIDASNDATPTNAPANDAAPVETFVTDLAYTVVANGFGPAEKDKSNGEMPAGDGKTLTLGGVTYAKGLGVHAPSDVDVPLGGKYKTFLADVGVDDEVTGGSVVFRVLADGQQIYDSGPMTGATATKKVSVDVTGKQTLKLVVTDNGDGIGQDHADWANARLQ